MPATTRQPNGDGTIIEWSPDVGANFEEVNEGVSTPDDATSEVTSDGGNNTKDDFYEIQNMPGDFGDAVDFKVRVRGFQTGRVDDTPAIDTRIFESDESTAIGTLNSHDVTSVTSFQTFEGAVDANTDDAATWNARKIHLEAQNSASGMADEITWTVTAIEVLLNYDVATGVAQDFEQLPNQPQRVSVGVVPSGPGPL